MIVDIVMIGVPLIGGAFLLYNQYVMKKYGYSPKQQIFEWLKSRKYPVRVFVMQKIAGGYRCYDDLEGRFINKDGTETIKSAKDKIETPPVDYSLYFSDKKGLTRAICLEVDHGVRYPLYPLTYGDVFIYDGDKIITDKEGTPLIGSYLVKEAKDKQKDDVIGLKAISKNRLDWLKVEHEKDLILHPEKKEHDYAKIATIFVGLIFVVLAIILFFQGGIPAIEKAKDVVEAGKP